MHKFKNKIDKACFQHEISYSDFKNLIKRIITDKILRDEAFNITESPKCD